MQPNGFRPSTNPFGDCLSHWRAARRESQLSLALSAGVSQRHLSFIESGRSRPSREMVARLCDALDVPLRGRNELYLAAGFAPLYSERQLDSLETDGVAEALRRILAHHEPFPAYVLDRSWTLVTSNAAGRRVIAIALEDAAVASPDQGGAPTNFMRLMFGPLSRRIRNWDQVSAGLLARLQREAWGDPASPSAELLRDLVAGAPPPVREPFTGALSPILNVELDLRDTVVRLFNTITTFGTPQDVTVQELRIDMSFPADATSEALLRRLSRKSS
jgi:transcriptional regulator with XRE-family HTH domain